MARLPQPGSDEGTWGDILNDYLSQSHKPDGTLKDDVVTSAQIAPGSLTKADVGLGNVDNTSDIDKPVSAATQNALNNKADSSSLAAKLNTSDLDTQVASRVSDQASATATALSSTLSNYYGKTVPSYAGARTRPFDPFTNTYASIAARVKVRRAMGFVLGSARSSLVNVLIAGDSFSAGWKANIIGTDDWGTLFISQLREAGYPVTGGWVFPANGNTPGDSRWVFSGTGTWQGRTSTVNNYIWSSSGAGNAGNIATFTSQSTGTVAEFAVFGNVGATINWDLDNGAQTGTTTIASSSGVTFKQFTGLSDTTHTIRLTTTSSAIWVAGARVRGTTGLSITNAGIYGSHTDDWLPSALTSAFYNPYNLSQGLMGGVPKLTLVCLGGNDAIHSGHTPASMKSNLQTIVNAYQNAGSCVVQRIYPYMSSTAINNYINVVQAPGVTWDNFLSNMYDVSDTADTLLIDHSYTLGDPNTLSAAGLMHTDNLHLLTPGQAAIARADYNALLSA